MAGTNIKLFDENKGNIMGDGEYAGNAQRLNGVQSGVASSALNNKFAYQMSLVCYAIAQMMNANGLDANDTLAVSAFVSNLSNSVLQKVIDKASTSDVVAGTTNNTKWITPLLAKTLILNTLAGNITVGGLLTAASLKVNGASTLTGAATFGNTVTLNRNPTANLQAATKQYVDSGLTSNLGACLKFKLLDTFKTPANSGRVSNMKTLVNRTYSYDANTIGYIVKTSSFVCTGYADYDLQAFNTNIISLMNGDELYNGYTYPEMIAFIKISGKDVHGVSGNPYQALYFSGGISYYSDNSLSSSVADINLSNNTFTVTFGTTSGSINADRTISAITFNVYRVYI